MAECLVVSWNVRGLNSAIKRSLVLNNLKRLRPQVCVLQETHLVVSRVLSLRRAWVGAHYHAPYSNYARGVSILVHRSLPFRLLDVKLDPGGQIRAIACPDLGGPICGGGGILTSPC